MLGPTVSEVASGEILVAVLSVSVVQPSDDDVSASVAISGSVINPDLIQWEARYQIIRTKVPCSNQLMDELLLSVLVQTRPEGCLRRGEGGDWVIEGS